MIGVKHERKNKFLVSVSYRHKLSALYFALGVNACLVGRCECVCVCRGWGYLQIIVCESSLRVGQRNIFLD